MNKNIKYKGRLWLHFNWPLLLIILLVLLNVTMYCYDIKSGGAVSVFLGVYVLAALVFWLWNKTKIKRS